MPSPEPSFKSLLSELIGEINQLIRQELRLAQAEAAEKIDQAQTGIVSLVAGLLLAFVAMVVLAQALVLALAHAMPAWLASVTVGVVLAVIGFATIKAGQSKLKPGHLTPERTMRTVRHAGAPEMEKGR